jgi:hypothetical protein
VLTIESKVKTSFLNVKKRQLVVEKVDSLKGNSVNCDSFDVIAIDDG